MPTTNKLKKGQPLYSYETRRGFDKGTIREDLIAKVGTKYFYLEGDSSPYSIARMGYENGQQIFYTSKQEMYDLQEHHRLRRAITDAVQYNHALPLNTLRQLAKVLNLR